ncbi:ABC transporter permease [uncultured Anaerococcus sp.]|uniref:ABC transporter permease n=1 Tax=uncultured Anaerococcus sp. TaxID=293428 RepID=UPI00280BE014|nr:ABC transporter permease [uncultured Anaerococcus sp.]
MIKENKNSIRIGKAIIGLYFLILIVSIFWTPYDPNKIDTSLKLLPPSLAHPFGTDNMGRDILSRLMEGSKYALILSFGTVSLALFLGSIIGAAAGYFGGGVDEVLMRFIDSLMAFPGILFAMMLVTVFGAGVMNTILAIGIMSVPYFARVVRSGFLQVKNAQFVKSAMVKGASPLYIGINHILPNIKNQVMVAIILSVSQAILAEAGLSYLGLGVRPPNPSWGRMLKESQAYFSQAPHYFIFTGICLSLVVLGFTLYGEKYRSERLREKAQR